MTSTNASTVSKSGNSIQHQRTPPDLVHPDPFPRGAHEHHLLRHMPEGPDALASTLEALRGARWQVLDGRIRRRALARGRVEIRGPVAGRLVVDGNHAGLL